MTNEEAIRILEDRSNLFRKFQHIKESESVEISNTELNCPALLADQYRKVADACDLAINALSNRPTSEPLTLEQLREMDEQPVWVKVLGWTDIRCDGWCEVEVRHQNTTDEYAAVAWPGSEIEDIGRTEDYGKTWLAYAYPPAHIDREAWTSEWKDHYKSGASAGTGYVCSSCDMWNGRKSHICPSCGKAMDEDGLAMLEKRLRGW